MIERVRRETDGKSIVLPLRECACQNRQRERKADCVGGGEAGDQPLTFIPHLGQ